MQRLLDETHNPILPACPPSPSASTPPEHAKQSIAPALLGVVEPMTLMVAAVALAVAWRWPE